jgi:hypothetical protein
MPGLLNALGRRKGLIDENGTTRFALRFLVLIHRAQSLANGIKVLWRSIMTSIRLVAVPLIA